MTPTSLVRLEFDGSEAKLTFANPPLNIINIALMTRAWELIRASDWQGIRTCVLAGEGKAFSAGVDVGEHIGPTCESMLHGFHALFRALLDLPCALIARVQGACLGGAAELLLACDAVIVADDAKLGFPEINLGVFPPIACAVLDRAVGRLTARRLILTGEMFSGTAAAAMGLATRAVPAAELDKAVASEAALLSRHSAAAIRETRRAMADVDLTRIEEIYLKGLMKTADAGEGLVAFVEKRAPKWSDR